MNDPKLYDQMDAALARVNRIVPGYVVRKPNNDPLELDALVDPLDRQISPVGLSQKQLLAWVEAFAAGVGAAGPRVIPRPTWTIGRTDGRPLTAMYSGLDRAVPFREFDALEAAHQFQKKFLAATDPAGLARGDYYLDGPPEEPEFVQEARTVRVHMEGGVIQGIDVPPGVVVLVEDADETRTEPARYEHRPAR